MSLSLLTRYGLSRGAAGPPPATFWAVETFSGFASVSLPNRVGWRFTVGGSNLEINRLRVYLNQALYAEDIRIHRWSDGVLIAQASVGPSSVGYASASITPVTLVASTDYVVSYRAPFSRSVARNPSSLTINAAVTQVSNLSGPVDDMPTVTSGNSYTAVDFGYQ